RATLPRVRTTVEVACGGAVALVPLQGPPGLGSRPDIAAGIAAATGGRMVEETGPGEEEEGRGRAAVWATLLAAAALVVVSAWRRRRT
ncbi:MAG: hypothetical protein L6Q95_18030, partial [Planctomycetes bacterium]|nr:hypothetical protein [Planctomycetota bacterium]